MAEATGEARYEALRVRYWELAGIEGVGLARFVEEELALKATRADVERLKRLVDDVEDTALKNIAVKAGEEGGMYEALADERTAEIAEERAELLARLDRALADAG